MNTPEEVTIYNMMATPFKDDGALDLDSYAELLEIMIDAKIGVYIGSGGAGEGHALSLDEHRQIYRNAVATCKGKTPLAANPREPRSAISMLELASIAAEEGIDVVQLYSLDPGHGMRPTPAELETYYRFLLDRFDYPTAISVHAYYPYPVPPSFVAQLCADYPQIQIVNCMMQGTYLIDLQDELAAHNVTRTVKLYSGDILGGLYAGSYGTQMAEPNLIPYTMRRLAVSVLTGDEKTIAKLYPFYMRFGRICNRWAPSTARYVKMGLRVLDMPGRNGVMRQPYLLPDETQQAEMRAAFDKLGVKEMEQESKAANKR